MATTCMCLLLAGLGVGTYRKEPLTAHMRDRVHAFEPALHEYLHATGLSKLAPHEDIVDVYSQVVHGRNYIVQRRMGGTGTMCYGVYDAPDGNATVTRARACTDILEFLRGDADRATARSP